MNSLRLLIFQLLVAGIASSESAGQTIAPRLPSTAALAAPSDNRNLLVNSNFENGTQGWELIAYDKKGTMAIDNEELHNGKPTLRIDNAEGDHSFVHQALTAKPNTRYRLTAFIKTKNVLPVKPGGKSGAVLMVGGRSIAHGRFKTRPHGQKSRLIFPPKIRRRSKSDQVSQHTPKE